MRSRPRAEEARSPKVVDRARSSAIPPIGARATRGAMLHYGS